MAHLDQFPMFRLATLLARQLSSPIASRLKVYARDHPMFGREVCARAGRWYHVCELRFKLWSLRLAGPRTPVAISDREAIEIGTDILGEAIIFALGAFIVIFEVNRQAMNKEAKSLDKRSRWIAIRVSLEELKTELEIQQREIDLLLAAIRELDPEVPLPLPSSLMKPPPAPPPPAASAAAAEPASGQSDPPGPRPVPFGASPAAASSVPRPPAAPPVAPPPAAPAPVAPQVGSTAVTLPPGCTCPPLSPPPPPPPCAPGTCR